MTHVPEYVYGIVNAGVRPPSGDGIAGAPVRVIASGDVAALVSGLADGEPALGPEHVMLHARVLEEAVGAGITVLPMRFGVVLADAGDVRARLLDRHRERLRAQLRELAGKVELNLRVIYEEDALMRQVVRGDDRIGQIRQVVRSRPEAATYYERIQLGELVAEGIERRREADADELISALAPIATAVEVREPAHERIALSASFLVESDRLSEFDRLVDQVARGHAQTMRFKYTGPLPPHSFVELTEGA